MDSRNPESQTLSGEEYRPHNLESPTDIHCHQSSMHALDIHASPGEFDKSSKITNVNEYITSDTRAPPVSLRKTNYGLDGVFDIVFDGEFDQDGGVLSHEDSDVYVIIPRGAIPVGIIQKVVVRVSLSHSFFRGSLETSHIPMTPVVECLAPGLDRFLKHVTVRLPHHVKMTGSNLKFKLHFSQSLPGNRMTWNSMTHTGQKEANNIVNEVHCTLDGKYVNVHTKHFTTFKCSCGKDVSLNLEAVAFGDHQVFDKQELAVKVYICYRTKDYLERLAVNEGKNQRSEYIPLNARHNAEPYEITCLGDRGAEDPWTSWKLNDHGGAYPAKQVMQLMDIVRHCSDGVSPHRRFVFVPSDDEWKTNFKVLFSVKQPSDEDVNHVPLNMKCGETRIKRITSSSSVGSLSSDLEFKTHEIRKISSKIKTISEMKNLLRILLEDADDLEPTMENIDHDYAPQGADEVKYQLLSLWKSRMGMKASVSDLTNALQECKLNSVAEKLESTV
uniref:Uncharacterized protein LOC100369564 n=1 Tax=Saccoglossus kowalevskii TaxID=10224 RepID=A0ABM0M6Y4_SACKO|nr:PREDICTED: uncharacterized protein LOC100369564 [Saccoglossus kowalevskii]